MQLSSGILHIQRIQMITNYDIGSTMKSVLKWSLTITWGWARLISFPYVQYLSYISYPLTYLHIFCAATGFALNFMNALWLVKIINMKSLAFGSDEQK